MFIIQIHITQVEFSIRINHKPIQTREKARFPPFHLFIRLIGVRFIPGLVLVLRFKNALILW